MDIITLDFETYFDKEYTLKKLTTEDYIRNPKFDPHGCAVRMPDGETGWYNAYELFEIADTINNSVVLCHHAHFDGLILAHHYGIRPRGWLCTLSMARLVLGNHVRVGLESLASHFGLGAKLVPYSLMEGKHWDDMSFAVREMVQDGGMRDCELTYKLFNILAKEFPAEEYGIVDDTIRMFTEPVIVGDTQLLAQVWQDEVVEKQALLDQLGVTQEQLRSADTFTQLLRAQGVSVEYKKGANGPIPAFAKSDDFMRDLLDDPDDTIRLLAEARIDAQSAFAETRAARLGYMSTRGAMCVYINFCGAHTTRDSGGDKVNFQNFQRRNPAFPKRGRIRQSMCAPPGQKILVVDASQIECRMLNEFAGQDDIVEKFRQKRDLYSELASQFYGFTVTKENPAERGTGKQLELSCGYGAGDHTIMVTAKKGVYGPPVVLTIDQAGDAKTLYRGTHQQVVRLWKSAGELLKLMGSAACDFQWGCVRVVCDGFSRKRIVLPNGAPLIYDTLEWFVPDEIEQDETTALWDHGGYWRIRTRRGYAKLYGAKLVENVIQAIARVHVFQVALKFRAAGLKIWLRAHDELAMVVADDANAQLWLDWCIEQMRTPPAWMPNVPLDAEGGLSHRYEK